MDLITTADGWQFLLRYVHFLAGVTWIGVLYYFNFIQTPFFGSELGGTGAQERHDPRPGPQRPVVVPLGRDVHLPLRLDHRAAAKLGPHGHRRSTDGLHDPRSSPAASWAR